SPHKGIVYPDSIGIVLYIQDVFAGLYLCNASPPTHRKERHTYPWYQHQHRCGIVEPHSHSLSFKPTMDAREMKVRDVYGERHQLAFNEPGMIERNEYVSVYMRKRKKEKKGEETLPYLCLTMKHKQRKVTKTWNAFGIPSYANMRRYKISRLHRT
ncbi:hypothetical protein V1478_017251, partial [Vespula squamosa]